MEYNPINMKFKTPPSKLRLKYLKIDMIRVSILKEFISKNIYLDALNSSITNKRIIINEIG